MSHVKDPQLDSSGLPRWIQQPYASDLASAARLEFECTSGENGDGLAGYTKPHHRFMQALDLVYGADAWPAELARYPHMPGGWMPFRPYKPGAYEVAPDGPPQELRERVDAWQGAQDQAMRNLLERNGWGSDPGMLHRHCVPPADLELV